MKKKIFVIVAIAALFLVYAVIVTGIKDARIINQIGTENGHPLKQDGVQWPSGNVTELTGILECSNDSFYLDDIQLLFGPDDMIDKQASPFDYDSDEVIETIMGEMNGLVGYSVNVKGHIIEENQIMVFDINGLPVGKPLHPPALHDHDKGLMGGDGLRP